MYLVGKASVYYLDSLVYDWPWENIDKTSICKKRRRREREIIARKLNK